jgi:hypothetical protein
MAGKIVTLNNRPQQEPLRIETVSDARRRLLTLRFNRKIKEAVFSAEEAVLFAAQMIQHARRIDPNVTERLTGKAEEGSSEEEEAKREEP